jgi:squalene synthase HpnC
MTAAAAPPLSRAPTRDAVMAQAGEENFPVALRILGATKRAHLLSLYGFARLVDDAGDEADGDRLSLLDAIEADLNRIFEGEREPELPLLRTLALTVRELGLPPAPFHRLIEAGRRDQFIDSYPTYDSLLDYCRLSAAPVGELVLHVFGSATPDRVLLSDSICAGLQVTEHLQDIAEDRAKGRVYIPAEDLERYGCTDDDLRAETTPPQLSRLIEFEVARAKSLLDAGAPLIGRLPASAAIAVAGFVAGGRAALGAIERAGYDVLSVRPRPARAAFARAFLATATRRR